MRLVSMEVHGGAIVRWRAERVVGLVGGWRVAAVDKPPVGTVTIDGEDPVGFGGLETPNSAC
jgi:hypothetical protein